MLSGLAAAASAATFAGFSRGDAGAAAAGFLMSDFAYAER